MTVKVSSVSGFDVVRVLDGRASYIGFTVTKGESFKGSVPPRLAEDLASIVSKSKPVLILRKHSITDVIGVLEEASSFRVVEYRIPIPPQTASIMASRLAERGVRLAPLVVWDDGWRPANPCKYITFTRAIAGVEPEYVIVKPSSEAHGRPVIPGRELKALECVDQINLGDNGIARGNVCSMLESGVRMVDIEMGGQYGVTRRDVLDIIDAALNC
ncbi:MAG: hypothetical protein GSR85_02430 [Desulfurococcales archaeon]|nr:hypothetical protein [Desulfurococcales archaeon]